MGNATGTHDPSAPSGHLPGFARKERRKRFPGCVNTIAAKQRCIAIVAVINPN